MGNSEEVVNNFIAQMFENLKYLSGAIDFIFGIPADQLDADTLWTSFRDVSYREIFKRSAGDINIFVTDYGQSLALQTEISKVWPETYYLSMLEAEGIVHKFETKGEEVTYAVKEAYIPVLNAILTEVDSNDLS